MLNFQKRQKVETSVIETVIEVDGNKQVAQADISLKHSRKNVTIDVSLKFTTKHISFDPNQQSAAIGALSSLLAEAYDDAVNQLSNAMDQREKEAGLQDMFAIANGVTDFDGGEIATEG